MALRKLAPWLPNYVKAWGPTDGLAMFWRVAQLSAANPVEARELRVPGLSRPIWLRAALHDISIFQQVWVKREYDLRHAAQFQQIDATYQGDVARGRQPLIIDCGAHIGMSVLWWRHLFPKAQIVAVEPSSANVAVLRRNVDGMEGVTVLHGGIWNQPGTLRIQDPAAGMASFQLGKAQTDGESVRAYTIKEIMTEAGCDECLLVKIDIEGGEDTLFRDNLAWLDRTHCVTVELHDWLYPWAGKSRSLFQATSERNFDYIMQGENMLCFQQVLRPRFERLAVAACTHRPS